MYVARSEVHILWFQAQSIPHYLYKFVSQNNLCHKDSVGLYFVKKNICCVQIVGVVTISLYLPVPGNVYITIILDLQVLINVDIYNNYTKSKYGSVRCIYYNHTRSTSTSIYILQLH